MGKNGNYKPLSKKIVKSIMASNPTPEEVKRSIPLHTTLSMSRRIEYDSLHPEEAIREFLSYLRRVQSRYDENLRLVEEYQLQKTDLDHFAEFEENLNRTDGHALYRKIRDMWRKRRKCKNEAELLKPVVEFMSNYKDAINQLSLVQGKCRQAKEMIDQREYAIRTGILDDLLAKKDAKSDASAT